MEAGQDLPNPQERTYPACWEMVGPGLCRAATSVRAVPRGTPPPAVPSVSPGAAELSLSYSVLLSALSARGRCPEHSSRSLRTAPSLSLPGSPGDCPKPVTGHRDQGSESAAVALPPRPPTPARMVLVTPSPLHPPPPCNPVRCRKAQAHYILTSMILPSRNDTLTISTRTYSDPGLYFLYQYF